VPWNDDEPAAILDTIAGGFIMLRYRAVLFDLDGTLVDSYGALADAVNYARRQHALGELSEATIREFVGEGIEKLLQRAFDSGEVPLGVRDAFERRYDEICCAQSRVLDEVHATLQVLYASGVAMAVCTNKPSTFSRKILDFLELSPFFQAILGPDLTGSRKPEARHVLQTLLATHCHPHEALFVGDMPIDVRAARNSGLQVAVVATGSSTPDVLRASLPDHYLEHFSDLVGLVRNGAEA
jgi:phosphoglycolate phosphatase